MTKKKENETTVQRNPWRSFGPKRLIKVHGQISALLKMEKPDMVPAPMTVAILTHALVTYEATRAAVQAIIEQAKP